MPLGRNMRRISQLGEKQTATDVNGKRQPASGATTFAKGDVKCPDWLIERKDTSNKSYSLKISTLETIRLQAIEQDKNPVLQIKFLEHDTSFAIIPWFKFLGLITGS